MPAASDFPSTVPFAVIGEEDIYESIVTGRDDGSEQIKTKWADPSTGAAQGKRRFTLRVGTGVTQTHRDAIRTHFLTYPHTEFAITINSTPYTVRYDQQNRLKTEQTAPGTFSAIEFAVIETTPGAIT